MKNGVKKKGRLRRGDEVFLLFYWFWKEYAFVYLSESLQVMGPCISPCGPRAWSEKGTMS